MPPKPKLTPEEKKELKAQKKLEKKQKQLEKKQQIQRDYLDRESKYGYLTLKQHEKEWRQILINIAVPEMKKDLEFAWHNFERVIDCKDFIISLLMDELDQAHQQYFLNLKAHSEHIDQLILLFEDRMQELENEYKSQIELLEKEHKENVTEIKMSTTDQENYVKTILYILRTEMKEVKRTRRAEYFSKLEEQDSKQGQLVERIKGILEQVHLNVWMDIVAFLNEYKNRIKERKKLHNELKVQDDNMQTVIKKQLESIRKALNTIRSLKLKKAGHEKFLGRKLADLQSEYDFFAMAFETLKKNLDEDRKKDFEQLKLVTISYDKAIVHLNGLETKGEHILNMGAVCRKLETLDEKILPFPVNFLNEMSKPSVNEFKEYVSSLDFFWQKVGKADTCRYAVNEEREYLIAANNVLRKRIHHYCKQLKCSSESHFTIKPIATRHVTEAAFEVKKYQKHASVASHFTTESESEQTINLVFNWSDKNLQEPTKNEPKLPD